MKQNFNFLILKRTIFFNFFILFCTVGLFGADKNIGFLSSEKSDSLLLKPIDDLTQEQYDKFILGKSFFSVSWVKAPSTTTARDGLGPLFNADSCISCHPKNAGTNLFHKNEVSRGLVARLSIKSSNTEEDKEFLKYKGFIPEPVYGSQLAINGIFNVKPEGKVHVQFEEKEVFFPDGEKQVILKPKYSLENLNYGSLHKDVSISYRLAPTLNGMALIDLIPNEEILANIDKDDKNKDGIYGKANWVYSNITNKIELGKYTWKASVPFLKEQIALAASNDIGITTSIFQNENCTKYQKECLESPKAKDKIDLPDERLDAISFYLKNIQTYAPKKSLKYKQGLALFEKVSCSKCHISSFDTKKGFKVSPFSDFLLHDMGDELSDGRVEFEALENDWRTAPLWGLALQEKINNEKPRLLHDGRARSFQEAILWHGGEAQKSKENYMNLSKKEREKLIRFLEEL